MKISCVHSVNFGENSSEKLKKRELIDVISDSVKNPRDVNDMVAVPRGIFKAYMLIMSGSALLALSNLIPAKKSFGKASKNIMVIAGWALNTLSALYFAKPFAFKGNSPTVKREDVNK